MSTESPADITRKLIEQARQKALLDEWEEYELGNEILKEARGLGKATRNKNICHGWRRGYTRGCRCDACKQANSEYLRKYRLERGITKSIRTGRHYTHGTCYGYQCGCRCAECTEAMRVKNTYYRERRKNVEKIQSGTESTVPQAEIH